MLDRGWEVSGLSTNFVLIFEKGSLKKRGAEEGERVAMMELCGELKCEIDVIPI